LNKALLCVTLLGQPSRREQEKGVALKPKNQFTNLKPRQELATNGARVNEGEE
jgi:hypothetical protein